MSVFRATTITSSEETNKKEPQVWSNGVLPSTQKIGVSLPPMDVADLPSPEKVYKVKRIGLDDIILFILGPGLIAIGLSISSSEWLLGPLVVARGGLPGLGWIMLISILLQVFYNVELARYTVATGEVPVVGFGRVPPGFYLWVPLALACLFVTFILGEWTVNAGGSLFALLTGRQYIPAELEIVRLIGIGLLFISALITLFGQKIVRTLEIVQGIMLVFLLVSLILVTIIIVPLENWSNALNSIFSLDLLTSNADPAIIGALAGFTALASGLNFLFIGYYRDKGYGMGYKTGYIASLFSPSHGKATGTGKIFRETEANSKTWRRWYRYLLLDQWGLYFPGVLIGSFLPLILASYLAASPGMRATDLSSMFVFTARQLGSRYDPILFTWALIVGFIILFSTQLITLELLARNLTDALFGLSPRLRTWIRHDPRRIYYPAILGLVFLVSITIHSFVPEQLLLIAGNLANGAALVFPLLLIYLNRKLPRPARSSGWAVLVLVLNVLFFGYFFIRFLYAQMVYLLQASV